MIAAPVDRSGRRSVRVESPEGVRAQIPASWRFSAPERSTPSDVLVSSSRLAATWPPERPDNGSRAGRRRLAEIRDSLSPRDWSILKSLADHRFLTTTHIQFLHFYDHATASAAARICRRALTRLAELRVIGHLERRIGGLRAGSASYVWRVDVLGDQLLRMAAGEGARVRLKEPSERWLQHCLAVAELHITLVGAARRQELELLNVQTEPTCWRPYLGASGSHLKLKPDLYAVTASGEFEDHFYIEVDRATESVPTLLGKCLQYETYRRIGIDQEQRGVFPVVAWVVPGEPRARRLQAAIRASRRLDPSLFRVTTTDRFLDLVTGAAR